MARSVAPAVQTTREDYFMSEQTSKSLARSEAPAEIDPFEGWTPFRELFGPGFRMPRIFDELLGARAGRPARWAPAVDIAEDDQKYVITAEIPGASKEDVHVDVNDNMLTIRGEKRSEREEKRQHGRWIERSYGSFSRSFTLPADASADRVNAAFKDGVLTLELPKVEVAKPKQIAIK
jgi:HSP20 family protein